MQEKIIEILKAYGWFEIDSKNQYMLSFKDEEEMIGRINYYFTRGTITFQNYDRRMTTIRECSVGQLEDLLIKIQKEAI